MENEGKGAKTTILAQNHELVVTEETRTILIGGRDVNYKHFTVAKSKEMETYLNQQAIIKAASPLVSEKVINDAMQGLKGLVTSGNSSGKKMIKNLAGTLMTVLVSPNPAVVFGGQCDPLVDKKVCTGAIMAQMQTSLPSIIPSLFMDNFFGGDDDETEGNGSGTDKSNTIDLM